MRTRSPRILVRVGIALACLLGPAVAAHAQWTAVSGAPNASTCLLLTDGSVICQEGEQAHSWRRLIPDQFGHYDTGTWTSIASFPSTYGPLYYASAVLADGRVLVIGGEYNTGTPNCPSNPGCEVNIGYIYDPVANTWTALTAPETSIGDSDSFVLPDGSFILRHLFSTRLSRFNSGTNDFSQLNATGKADNNSEEGSALLPNGTVLTVNAGTQGGTGSQIYDPATNAWTSAGSTMVSTVDNGGLGIVPEAGPLVLRPDGTVVAFGATAHNAIYDTLTGNWTAGPDFPTVGSDQMLMADAPAALLPNGNILVITSKFFAAPYHAFEFDTSNTFAAVTDPPGNNRSDFQARMVVLPTGQVLLTNGTNTVQLYTPSPGFNNAWRPVITSGPSKVVNGTTYTISGKQFNGMSQASMYGDDAQMATNYPLVRIINHATGHVCYARTHDHSSMGVATGNAIVSTQFDGPSCLESGESDLIVVANGIPSEPIVINGVDLTITKTHAPTLFTQGDTGDTFTITIGNAGAASSSGTVTVTDSLPASLTATAMSGAGWTCNVGTLTCTRSDALAPGSTYPITLTVDVAGNAPILVTNTATVSGGGEASTINVTANDTATDDVHIRQHTTTTVQAATQDYHDDVTLTATVTPAGVAGSVAFRIDGSFVGTGTYSSVTGVATLVYNVAVAPGPHTIRADFTSSDPLYLDSFGTNTLTVTREETTTIYTGPTVIANGLSLTVSGLLREDGVVPIAGRTVTFTLGSGGSAQICSGTTDVTGIASCIIYPVAQPLGPGIVKADFAGDVFYLPSSGSATTILFAFLTNGAFAVGDVSAGANPVTFWGSSWSKDNVLSGGPAPSAFKGFANGTAEPPNCTSNWTSQNGGNSTNPPSTVPSYMGVLVPTTVTQSGSTLSGDVLRIVVVHTDPGYEPAPGHAGTGQVIATYCVRP